MVMSPHPTPLPIENGFKRLELTIIGNMLILTTTDYKHYNTLNFFFSSTVGEGEQHERRGYLE